MSLRLMSAIIPANASKSGVQIEDASKVLSALLESVQQCQKKYGGKKELATELDSCVATLCLSLEAVFQHGLRVKPLETVQQTSTLKQVSDIVSNSLSLSNGDVSSFWPFIKSHLTKHERERYEVLKHIWTDTGRSRAWIRCSLNERSLERNFHIVLSNQDILKTFYENWAALRNDDTNSMLPNMAAGLGSILFAVNIDKPELNSETLRQKSERLKVLPEPIIEAPLREPSKEHLKDKRKRKVAKQLILFDDDDSIMSSSVPSSCSSTNSSDSISTTSGISVKSESLQKSPVAPPSEETRSESNMVLESSENVIENFDGTLMPMEINSIGELKLVSEEKREVEISSEKSPDTSSDDIIEMPSDISAVLTALETKNQEDINKMQRHVDAIMTENENLKEQLKKYVGAVQMLKRDDASFQKALKGLQPESREAAPDYESEAKVYEQKLVQVAEMHAELMDFNTLLQQKLLQKDALVERLKCELEELRGPMSPIELAEDAVQSVNIWIPSAFLTGSGSNAHHVYQIFLRAGSDEWNIYRRYAQFHALHSDLKKVDPTVAGFDFPPKKSIGRKDSYIVEDRRKRFQAYLRRILSHWPELAHCNSRYLLEQHLEFFKDPSSNDRNKRAVSGRRNPNSNDPHYTGL